MSLVLDIYSDLLFVCYFQLSLENVLHRKKENARNLFHQNSERSSSFFLRNNQFTTNDFDLIWFVYINQIWMVYVHPSMINEWMCCVCSMQNYTIWYRWISNRCLCVRVPLILHSRSNIAPFVFKTQKSSILRV